MSQELTEIEKQELRDHIKKFMDIDEEFEQNLADLGYNKEEIIAASYFKRKCDKPKDRAGMLLELTKRIQETSGD